MLSQGYEEVSDIFLVKQFGEIEINVTKRSTTVEAVTGYINSDIAPIPQDVLSQVKGDINKAVSI